MSDGGSNFSEQSSLDRLTTPLFARSISMSTKPSSFRFSLRTLFVVVAVCGAVLGRLHFERRAINERNMLADWIDDRNNRESASRRCIGVQYFGSKSVPWYRRVIGDRGPVAYIDACGRFTREEIDRVEQAFPEAKIFMPRVHDLELLPTFHALPPRFGNFRQTASLPDRTGNCDLLPSAASMR